jgi:hypothetical protein
MTRQTLPNRRRGIARDLHWTDGASEVRFTANFGFYDDGRIGEVFADTGKTTAMQSLMDDACVLISIALQYGLTPEQLSHSLGTVPVYVLGQPTEAPASPIGAILKIMTEASNG